MSNDKHKFMFCLSFSRTNVAAISQLWKVTSNFNQRRQTVCGKNFQENVIHLKKIVKSRDQILTKDVRLFVAKKFRENVTHETKLFKNRDVVI